MKYFKAGTGSKIKKEDYSKEIVFNQSDLPHNGHLAKRGDAFVCSPGDKHNLWNKTNKDFKVAVFKIDLPETDDTHWSN